MCILTVIYRGIKIEVDTWLLGIMQLQSGKMLQNLSVSIFVQKIVQKVWQKKPRNISLSRLNWMLRSETLQKRIASYLICDIVSNFMCERIRETGE